MKETTTHCDHCGNPLGRKCDRDISSSERARIAGIVSENWKFFDDDRWTFFCCQSCADVYLLDLCKTKVTDNEETIQEEATKEKKATS